MPAKLDGNPKNWLLIRKRDEQETAPGTAGRNVPADARDARRGACPTGEGWLYEVKWDGYRALAYLRGGDP